ncbi:hypothetical protein PNC201_06530 [Pseudoalteromonas sp. NC201]|nr:hypothetical protein PNC201_06530 [Pseudoalteromonas sp. NC201]
MAFKDRCVKQLLLRSKTSLVGDGLPAEQFVTGALTPPLLPDISQRKYALPPMRIGARSHLEFIDYLRESL